MESDFVATLGWRLQPRCGWEELMAVLKLQKPPMPFPEGEALGSLLVNHWHG